MSKKSTDEQWKELEGIFKKMDRNALVGFLLGAKDDEVFQPKDDQWLLWPHQKLAEEAFTAYLNMAIQMVKGKIFKSELRGPTPYGTA